MGGGLFGTPLYLNIKCVIFSGIIIGLYWSPRPSALFHKIAMSFLLALSAYISMAWYDVLYDCNDRFGPSLFGWMSAPLKPQYYSEEYNKLPVKYQKTVKAFDIFVLIVIAFTIIYPFLFK